MPKFAFVVGTLVLLTGGVAISANAKDVPCGKGLICASNPDSVVKGLQDAGYKAKLVTADGEDPYIETSMNGYSIDAILSDCEKNKKCKSLSFRMSFVEDPIYTAELANDWNKKYRFLQLYRLDKGGMGINYDISLVGGVNQANFTDITETFDAMLGALDKFINDASAAAEAKAAPAAGAAEAAAPTP